MLNWRLFTLDMAFNAVLTILPMRGICQRVEGENFSISADFSRDPSIRKLFEVLYLRYENL